MNCLKFFLFGLISTIAIAQQDPSIKPGAALKGISFRQKMLKATPVVTVKNFSTGITFGMQYSNDEKVEGAEYNYWPVVITGPLQSPKKIFGNPSQFKSWEWTEIRADLKRGYYWGILEYTVEGSAHTLPIVASFDAGKSWRYLTDIPKAHFTMSLLRLFMNEKGEGEVIFTGDATETRVSRATSADWGRTWKYKQEARDVLDAEPLDTDFRTKRFAKPHK